MLCPCGTMSFPSRAVSCGPPHTRVNGLFNFPLKGRSQGEQCWAWRPPPSQSRVPESLRLIPRGARSGIMACPRRVRVPASWLSSSFLSLCPPPAPGAGVTPRGLLPTRQREGWGCGGPALDPSTEHPALCSRGTAVDKRTGSDTPNHQEAVLIATEERDAAESGKCHRCSGWSGRLAKEGTRNRGPKSRRRQGGEGKLFQAEGTACAKAQLGRVHCGDRPWAGRTSGPAFQGVWSRHQTLS